MSHDFQVKKMYINAKLLKYITKDFKECGSNLTPKLYQCLPLAVNPSFNHLTCRDQTCV